MLHTSKLRLFFIAIVIAVSFLFTLPSFLPNLFVGTWLENKKINLGLDLRGGSYLLLEVDTKQYDKEQMSLIASEFAALMRKDKIKFTTYTYTDNKLQFMLLSKPPSIRSQLLEMASIFFSNNFAINIADNQVTISANEAFFEELHKNLIVQTLEIMRRRVDESGLKEIEIQRQGQKDILLQVPGVENPNEIKRLMGKTAKLSFHIVNENYSVQEVFKGHAPKNLRVLSTEEHGGYLVIENVPQLTGDMLVNAQATVFEGVPYVAFTLNSLGAKKFALTSSKNIGSRMAIVLDDKIISAPVINEAIPSGRGTIKGNFTVASANELAVLLKAGALPAPLNILEERTIGPSLGQDSIESGVHSMVLGIFFITITMLMLYKLLGAIALTGLFLNLLMLIGLLAISGASLTLPGIAGIVLTLGIAVDANVLIIERIKEEYKLNSKVLHAIESGFKMSFMTIFDANITTIFTAVLLYIFGTGPVKGFAITLIFGIVSSMFSAIVFTKFLTGVWYKIFRPKQLKF